MLYDYPLHSERDESSIKTYDLLTDPLTDRDILVDTPIASGCEVCVIVPVCDEAELLESCLKALLYQVDLHGKQLDLKRYEVIVFANNCIDNSASIARQFGQQHPEFKRVFEKSRFG